MVNRILIRIKVVQMLYSYLLTRNEFKIDTNPDLSSADKKFAYYTYARLLGLLIELTDSQKAEKSQIVIDKKLTTLNIGKVFATDSDIKSLLLKQNANCSQPLLTQRLHDQIVTSSAFRDFSRKRKKDLEDEVGMWITLFETLIVNDPELLSELRKADDFSKIGFEMAVNKVIDTLKSYYGARASYFQALQNLENSLRQSYKLYLSLFVLIVRLTEMRAGQLDAAKNKFLATSIDRNPNMRFVDNSFAKALSQNKQLETFIKEYGISWTDDYTLLNSLLSSIVASPAYTEYMECEETDWEKDCEFWRQILKTVVFQSDDLIEALEAESVFWNDDLHIIGTFVLKSIRLDAQNQAGEISFLPQYKDEEDSRFGAELFELAVKNRDKYFSYVEKFVDTANWESERIAFMDSVILICAIAEIINFPNIPLAVSFNEYIDIANLYSSSRSGNFINGILYSVVEYLKAENIIVKH